MQLQRSVVGEVARGGDLLRRPLHAVGGRENAGGGADGRHDALDDARLRSVRVGGGHRLRRSGGLPHAQPPTPPPLW